MQFGVFSVSDITRDPVSGETPSEAERIDAIGQIARKTEEVGLDVFATGEHHNPPFVASNPTATLAYIGAKTDDIILSTATTLITTTDPVLIAEDYAKIQHLTDGRVDLMMGRGNTGPVYPWFGKDIRQGINLAVENYALLHRLWREDVVDWEGRFRTPLQGYTSTPRPLDGVPPFVWHGSIRSAEIAEQAAGRPVGGDALGQGGGRAAALALHFAVGAAAGALYGPLAHSLRPPPVLGGVAYGLAVWTTGYLGILPALGALRPATEHPPRRTALMIAAHVVWGAALGLLADRNARRR